MSLIMTPLSIVPHENRPRERLLRSGADALGDIELLAVLLRTGRPGQSALGMAQELLDELGGLDGLVGVDGSRLKRRGLGDAKAATVAAAIELGRRLARARLPGRRLLDHPRAVARYLALRYARRDQEVMGALFLDLRQALIGERDVFRGTATRAAVEPRGILVPALSVGASSFLLFHTHPSGDPSPSTEDLAFTRRMADAGEVVGVPLADHLIVGDNGRFTSLRRWGAW